MNAPFATVIGMRNAFPIAAAVAALAISGCGGGSSPSIVLAPTSAASSDPTSQPTMTPDSPIAISSASGSPISLVGFGATAQLTASESGYSGDFIVSSSDANVATISPSLQKAGSGTYTVTAVNGGTATIAFSDAHGNTSTISVGVTTTSTVIDSAHRQRR